MQELSNRLDDVSQEKSNLLSKVTSLEESVSSAHQERTILEQKMNSLTEGKDEVQKKLGLVTESSETEKQVCCVGNLSSCPLDHFTVVYLVTCHLNDSETGDDLF